MDNWHGRGWYARWIILYNCNTDIKKIVLNTYINIILKLDPTSSKFKLVASAVCYTNVESRYTVLIAILVYYIHNNYILFHYYDEFQNINIIMLQHIIIIQRWACLKSLRILKNIVRIPIWRIRVTKCNDSNEKLSLSQRRNQVVNIFIII